MSATAHYLSAIIGRDVESLEVRTKPFSPANLDSLLKSHPAAIALVPLGMGAPERLLDLFTHREGLLSNTRRQFTAANRWRCYRQESDEPVAHRFGSLDLDDLRTQVRQLYQRGLGYGTYAAFVSEQCVDDSTDDSLIEALFEPATMPGARRGTENSDKALEAQNRQTLLTQRKSMLEKVGSFTSEDIAMALGSTTVNASQCAADQRKAGKLFGVRLGREWLYPRFQFDSARQPYPQIKPILAVLPDDRGWDRLQWFLTPHEDLDGKSPLEVWKHDRNKVVETACTERWNERD